MGSIPITRFHIQNYINTPMLMKNDFTEQLLSWFHIHGRHNLPWQQNPSPYRVWVSEIMLQQTQVSTVIYYYQRFIEKFSSITLLSKAPLDDVLNLWSGLGYYARARNLHRCAQIISQDYQADFPNEVSELIQLPGIGRSTAGAIISFSMNKRGVILDGNVKRVLTRYYAIAEDVNQKSINQKLWEMADQLTPLQNFAEYNQAIMDLGATVCTRRNPACPICPVQSQCQAYQRHHPHNFPQRKKSAKARVKKSTCMLIIQNHKGSILLLKRPPIGIWGGLWSLPECEMGEDIKTWCIRQWSLEARQVQNLPALSHTFSHFDLTIYPILIQVKEIHGNIMEAGLQIWYDLSEAMPGGVAAPVSKLLKKIKVIYEPQDLLSKTA